MLQVFARHDNYVCGEGIYVVCLIYVCEQRGLCTYNWWFSGNITSESCIFVYIYLI